MSQHGTTAGSEDLADVVRRQLAILAKQLPKAHRGQARGVHRARVASRRLREVVPIAEDLASSVRRLKVPRLAKRITASLGPVREMDVALKEFEADSAASPWLPEAVDRVRTHLEEERSRRAKDMAHAWRHRDLKHLEPRVAALADTCGDASAEQWKPLLAARLRKRAGLFRDAIRAAGTLYAADAIHHVRLTGKKLRYTLELAHAAGGAAVGREIGRLKRLQDLLGRLRDCQVLADHVRAVMAERDKRGVGAALEQIQADLEAECRALHAQFVKRSAGLADLAEEIGRRVPALLALPRKTRMAVMRGSDIRRRKAS
jgi:CHAD domain-containing protein